MPTVGVLALQGDFLEHLQALRRVGVEAKEVRLPRELEEVDGLIIPGGESTTIARLMKIYDLAEPIKGQAQAGLPIFGTCAGMIVVAQNILDFDQFSLDLIDIDVKRNAFGRQVDSFEMDLPVKDLGEEPFHTVFIRAPIIQRTGPEVKVIAQLPDGTPVAAKQGNVMVSSFHPELTDDPRFHVYFTSMINAGGKKGRQ
ncbi:MAG: pyridoxal 5'-phosphate synthase glutaminase subunit PdxT [Dehalococcoidia bacterium]